MAAPIAFRASSNAAFTQSDLKQRGKGGFGNPAEETQILAYETQTPSNGGPPLQASPLIALAGLNAMNFSSFPITTFAAVPPSNNAFKIGGGRLAGSSTFSDWPAYYNGDDGLPMARTIFPTTPLWRDPNGLVGPSGVQLGQDEGCRQMSYWVEVLGNGTFLNIIRAQKSRIRVNAPQTGFLCDAEIWHRWQNFEFGFQSEFFHVENVRFLRDFTLNPFEYFPIPMPQNQTFLSPYNSGFCGSIVFAVYAETRAEWSIRTGIPT